MSPERFEGWLTGVRVEGSSALLCFKTAEGLKVDVRDAYAPFFYLICRSAEDAEAARHMISQHPKVSNAVLEERFPHVESPSLEAVVRVTTESAESLMEVAADSARIPEVTETAETSVPHCFRHMMARGAWFFRKYRVEAPGGILKAMEAIDTEELPPLRKAAACRTASGIRVLTDSRETAELPAEGLEGFIQERGIDVLLSYGGDEFLPASAGMAWHGALLRGCIHIDVRRDVYADIYSEDYALEGGDSFLSELLAIGNDRLLRVMELSRISGAQPDLVSRSSPGVLNNFLHKRAARLKGYVVPDRKELSEAPKSLRMLSVMDRAGLIFYPAPGVYHDVAKCDFSSMYPSIIVGRNISPETLNCGCCAGVGQTVPEAGWHTCSRRRGIIPEGLAPVLEARLRLKRLMRAEASPERRREYDIRQKALKNILVTCFGYLGFSNFIFSNVECKESVMLFGRSILMRAKRVAESMGLDVIYGITDSLFVRNGGAEAYAEFCRRVSLETGIGLELDRIFRAVVFPCAAAGCGAANKYYGIDTLGGLESRGICLRHSDAPQLLRDFQENAIKVLLSGSLPEDIDANLGRARELLRRYKDAVMGDRLPLKAYAITMSLRRPAEDYVSNAPHVVAGRMESTTVTDARGGRHVTYVYSKCGPLPYGMADAAGINRMKYCGLLDAALGELIMGTGIGEPAAGVGLCTLLDFPGRSG